MVQHYCHWGHLKSSAHSHSSSHSVTHRGHVRWSWVCRHEAAAHLSLASTDSPCSRMGTTVWSRYALVGSACRSTFCLDIFSELAFSFSTVLWRQRAAAAQLVGSVCACPCTVCEGGCVHCLTCRFSVRPNSAWGFSDTCGRVSESGHNCSLHSPVYWQLWPRPLPQQVCYSQLCVFPSPAQHRCDLRSRLTVRRTVQSRANSGPQALFGPQCNYIWLYKWQC